MGDVSQPGGQSKVHAKVSAVTNVMQREKSFFFFLNSQTTYINAYVTF